VGEDTAGSPWPAPSLPAAAGAPAGCPGCAAPAAPACPAAGAGAGLLLLVRLLVLLLLLGSVCALLAAAGGGGSAAEHEGLLDQPDGTGRGSGAAGVQAAHPLNVAVHGCKSIKGTATSQQWMLPCSAGTGSNTKCLWMQTRL
jgi:hypothetical protein